MIYSFTGVPVVTPSLLSMVLPLFSSCSRPLPALPPIIFETLIPLHLAGNWKL